MGNLFSLFCPTRHTVLKTLTRFFGLSKKSSLKKFNRSYLQVRKGEMITNRALSDLKTPKLKEILITAVFMSHQNETIIVLKIPLQATEASLVKNFNSSVSFGQAALTFCLPKATSWLSWWIIFLEDGLPGPLPIGQVRFKSYLPNERIYTSRTTGQHFFQALWKPQKK